MEHDFGLRVLGTLIVLQEITEEYDMVEATLNRISVSSRPELHAKLTTAKDALFEARVLLDPENDNAKN